MVHLEGKSGLMAKGQVKGRTSFDGYVGIESNLKWIILSP